MIAPSAICTVGVCRRTTGAKKRTILEGVEARLTTHPKRAVIAPTGTSTNPCSVRIASTGLCAES